MESGQSARRLRVYLGESDRYQGVPAYEALVRKARDLGLAGATVLRGIMGYGAHSQIHTARLLELSSDLPVVVEIVDRADRLETFLPYLDALLTQGALVTVEEVEVFLRRPARPG